MRAKDILKIEDVPEEMCEVCMLHDKAYEVLSDNILCPICEGILTDSPLGYDGLNVVGETNGYDEEEQINKYPICSCSSCGKTFALMPVQIIYNGNHDIFYTGGKHYLPEDTSKLDKELKEQILPSVEQYTRRLKEGEDLKPWQLAYWIEGAIHRAVATFLYENGYKK